ncbi:UDP-N-acetylmuramoyl-L-alanyl-D-glutamate--2,6-diaminopimelate ligase [Halobacillus sp. BBL2006]|uniref:UDP-N-acetylmuramoyl-L-alanyl-D-glutamate--2, 6-diaminopimelate ligase n=1 Tax=Halobacillus sp. BBL2006 TaxID=1543706 RepID=UPI000541B73D|nr:UDP-N-acetylmuramoyl-L-alanyl-D-glutamate--2,6-diaminopimelate ligase [Halobacillus sp. BBL2006]KHE71005.1 UDP-N-acetylmuramoylalanyl-D-glutamate--2,6-diaminopimelate ligase [Halobacillus sp. BBL2006]
MMINFNEFQHMNIEHIFGPSHQEVDNLAFHSKRVEPKSAFFSIKGETFDGDYYIDEAIDRGATVIIGTDPSLFQYLSYRNPYCTFVVVKNIRKAMASFSKFFYDSSDENIKTIGVTGTNGKTTVAAYVRSLLTLLGLPTGSIGTAGIWSSGRKLEYKKSTPTTPESLDLHQIFRDFHEMNDEAAVMEVSSIALDQHRVDGIHFDVAIHTNFSEEHLEYHKTIDHYKECKMRLFKQAKNKVVNIDDKGMGEDLQKNCKGPMITYSIDSNPEADLNAVNIEVMEDGSFFELIYEGKSYSMYVPVYGTYNVANVLSAIGTALHLGFTIQEVIDVLPALQGPEGRFQVIQTSNNQKVILDYAHTPVALNRLLEEVKKLNHNRLIVMIAGIGIRDFNKMPKMAAAIEGKADEVVVTVDHPGYHDPQIIVDQVLTGFQQPSAPNVHTSLTRKEGVLKSLELGQENDIILLTSGCINNAQIVRGEEIPHSDEEIIENYFPPVVQ